MTNLCNFTQQFKEILLKEKRGQIPELMVAHLFGYLGFLIAASLEIEESEKLYPHIITLLEKQTAVACKQFLKYPLSSNLNQEVRHLNLETIRNTAPCSIIVQTLRLGRVIFDAIEELNFNRKFSSINKQTELFCPQIYSLNC